jgi:DNA-binding LacI/PurR family transcriptional regulator
MWRAFARVAEVSTATVSRVMRGSALVHPDTRDRVLAVIEALGFVPDASAQGLSMGRKDIIGLAALECAEDEIDIERSNLLFADQIVHATEAVLGEFQRAGIRVPGDVALTGFDDVHPSRLVDPPLTTVSQPVREIGTRAAQRLLARIEDRALPPRTEVLAASAVIRASCGCLPGPAHQDF